MNPSTGECGKVAALRRSWRVVIAFVLLAVAALELLGRFTELSWAASAAHGTMLLLVPVAARRLGLREAYLLALCIAVTASLTMRHRDPGAVIALALEQGAFLLTFVLLVSFVQEAARTSPSVAACGRALTRQPPSRRFLALFLGGNLMTVVFNLGSVSLIAPLVHRAAEAAPDDPRAAIRERRQLSAILRGVAWSVAWSPTAVAPLALAELMPEADRVLWIGLGFAISAVMMMVGWAEDAWRWRGLDVTPADGQRQSPLSGRAVAGFAAVSAGFAALTGVVMAVSGEGVPASLMLAGPMLLAVWLVVQNRAAPRPFVVTGRQIRYIVVERLPLSAPAAVTLACSGYLGRAGAELVPAVQLAAGFGAVDMPAWLFLAAIPLVMVALAQLALSPIMMAVFFGSLFGSMPELPAGPTLIALAITTGWSLGMTCSPFASAVILLNHMTGHPGTRLSWGWNLGFTVLAFLTLAGIFRLLAGAG